MKTVIANTVHKSTMIDMFYLYISYPSDVTAHGGHGDAYTLHIVMALFFNVHVPTTRTTSLTSSRTSKYEDRFTPDPASQGHAQADRERPGNVNVL